MFRILNLGVENREERKQSNNDNWKRVMYQGVIGDIIGGTKIWHQLKRMQVVLAIEGDMNPNLNLDT